MHTFFANNFRNRIRNIIILFMIISVFQSLAINVSAHQIRDIETIEYDITPQFRQSRFGPISVVIDKDSTTIFLGTISQITPQHVMMGYFNFSNIELEYDGMEAYQTILHQKIFMDFSLDYELELGRRSQKLSDSALHDGQLSFSYNLRNLDDLTWSPGVDYPSFKKYIKTSQRGDKTLFNIENSIEFIRGTKQNARFDLFYSIESYVSPPVPFDNFHYKQIMSSSVLPDRIMVEESSVIGTNDRIYLFLPDELIPKFFDSSDDHKLNLTKIPLKINLHLELNNSDNKFRRLFKIESGFYKGSQTVNDDHSEDYQLSIMLSDTSLIPITISSRNFIGEIKITISLEMRSLFADTGLYAKNDYTFSPNVYLFIISFVGTVFIYKLVDYVGYKTYENILAQKNYDLVEEDFMG